MTPKFLAYKSEWVVDDDSTFVYDTDMTGHAGGSAAWGWGCLGRVDDEIFLDVLIFRGS